VVFRIVRRQSVAARGTQAYSSRPCAFVSNERVSIMKKLLIAAVAIGASASLVNAKDQLDGLGARWCNTDRDSSPKEIEIVESAGMLFDGTPGEAPSCKIKRSLLRRAASTDRIVTWRCDANPAHEPEGRRILRSRSYEVTERLVPFTIQDSNGARRYFLLRDRLPPARGPLRIYEKCK
jgi:hypothetical protein